MRLNDSSICHKQSAKELAVGAVACPFKFFYEKLNSLVCLFDGSFYFSIVLASKLQSG